MDFIDNPGLQACFTYRRQVELVYDHTPSGGTFRRPGALPRATWRDIRRLSRDILPHPGGLLPRNSLYRRKTSPGARHSRKNYVSAFKLNPQFRILLPERKRGGMAVAAMRIGDGVMPTNLAPPLCSFVAPSGSGLAASAAVLVRSAAQSLPAMHTGWRAIARCHPTSSRQA